VRAKIGLYIEHGVGGGVGGAELLIAALASAWSQDHDVDLIHHRPDLTLARLAAFSTDDLSRVCVRCVARESVPPETRNVFRRYQLARAWHRDVSVGYDVFVNCTHWLPSFCHARRGILLVLFPIYVRPEDSEQIRGLPAWKRLRHAGYFGTEWSRRVGSYQCHVAISEFSRLWTRRRWAIDCDVVYPPVDVETSTTVKAPLILSVGRFVTRGHHKKQLEMIRAFRELTDAHARGWQYACVGGLNDRPDNHEYFTRVVAAATGCDAAVVRANPDCQQLRELYGRAAIFWHATGFDDHTDARPELAEHFGMATAEAMAAGCVPVVVNKGGQQEIVQHGQTGFLWNTPDELQHFTSVLIENEPLRQQMSHAARQAAARFSRARFVSEMSRRARLAHADATVAARPSSSKVHHELAAK
jgi:glycosyltransferase involved in cell wall biosynthesis